MKRIHTRFLLFIFLYGVALFVNAQDEICFTNTTSLSVIGNPNITRFIAIMPAPVTNEYQEISLLRSNCGEFISINEASKILFYDGALNEKTFDIHESFYYRSKKINIDFSNKSKKNIVTDVNPNNYLNSDGIYIDTSNETIAQIGNQLWSISNSTLDYAKHCYEYVASNYRYINGSWRTLEEILEIKGGECGDFTTIFVNLLRYKGIPARHNIGVWVSGGYHVWADFYHEDYGWVPVDPTFKNSNPQGEYFGRYNGNLIILSQDLTTFSRSDFSIQNIPLQTFYYWYRYQGYGSISGTHKTSNNYLVTDIKDIDTELTESDKIYNLQGIMQNSTRRGIYIINGKKVFIE